jgi:hypothetical protein
MRTAYLVLYIDPTNGQVTQASVFSEPYPSCMCFKPPLFPAVYAEQRSGTYEDASDLLWKRIERVTIHGEPDERCGFLWLKPFLKKGR